MPGSCIGVFAPGPTFQRSTLTCILGSEGNCESRGFRTRTYLPAQHPDVVIFELDLALVGGNLGRILGSEGNCESIAALQLKDSCFTHLFCSLFGFSLDSFIRPTTKDAQPFRSRDLFDDVASDYTRALSIDGRAEGGEAKLSWSYGHDAP